MATLSGKGRLAYLVPLNEHDPYITDDPPRTATHNHQITSQRPSQNGRCLSVRGFQTKAPTSHPNGIIVRLADWAA